MSETLTDQHIVELIGDMANYVGLPGPPIPPNSKPPQATGAQHPFYPLQASLVETSGKWVMSVGQPGQRCILPDTNGIPVPCVDITNSTVEPTGLGIPNNLDLDNPRIDLLLGQAWIYYSGTPAVVVLNAQFTYATGTLGSTPPAVPPNYVAVAQIVVPPGASPSEATVQMVLPSPQMVALPPPISGTGAQQNGSNPLTAVVVTGAPFNAPCIQGPAQEDVAPIYDASAAIQLALTYLGPGGAIYIPLHVKMCVEVAFWLTIFPPDWLMHWTRRRASSMTSRRWL